MPPNRECSATHACRTVRRLDWARFSRHLLWLQTVRTKATSIPTTSSDPATQPTGPSKRSTPPATASSPMAMGNKSASASPHSRASSSCTLSTWNSSSGGAHSGLVSRNSRAVLNDCDSNAMPPAEHRCASASRLNSHVPPLLYPYSTELSRWVTTWSPLEKNRIRWVPRLFQPIAFCRMFAATTFTIAGEALPSTRPSGSGKCRVEWPCTWSSTTISPRPTKTACRWGSWKSKRVVSLRFCPGARAT